MKLRINKIINKVFNSGFILIVIVYLIIYGSIIYKGDGIPYIIDNNETFSSLLHAKSIDSFGISKSKGLADEALGNDIDAHPYVHSHQGNYPRIFALIFYKLGAESPESQILITTFTIGLLSILVMFKFIELISNSRLAFIFSLVLISDYIFFAQSQIITYRLFFPLLLFVQLLSIELAIKKKGYLWKYVLVLNSFFLLYGELIFAFSVGLLGFVWLLYRGLKKPRVIINLSCVMLFGAFLGLTLLAIQGILYLGLDNFLYDVKITFFARNSFDNNSLGDISNFYQQNYVIFWENFVNGSALLNLPTYFNALFLHKVKYYGPLILLFISPPLIFWITSQFLPNSHRRAPKNPHISRNNFFNICKDTLGYACLTLSLVALFFLVSMYLEKYYMTEKLLFPFLLILASFVGFILLLLIKKIKIKLITVSVIFLSFFLFGVSNYLDNHQYVLWNHIHGSLNNIYVFFVFFGSLLSACIWLDGYLSLSNNNLRNIYKFKFVFIFFLISVFSFTVAYWLSPGYIFTGYISRYTSFLPHIFGLVLALSLCIQLDVIAGFFKETTFKKFFISLGVSFTLISSLLYWILIQYFYYQNLPPDHFSFLNRLLKLPPYKNSSFIVNTYPAPISILTESWAYHDTKISSALIKSNGGIKKIVGDSTNLWQADKETNIDYKKPDFYLCFLQQTPQTLNASLKFRQGLGSKPIGCDSSALFKMADNKLENHFISLVDYDRNQNAGFMSWAILKFDWNSNDVNEIFWTDHED